MDCPHGFILDSEGSAMCVCATSLETVTRTLTKVENYVPEQNPDDTNVDGFRELFDGTASSTITPRPPPTVHYSLPPTVEVIYSPYDVFPDRETHPTNPYKESLNAPTETVHSFYEDPPILIDDHFSTTNHLLINTDILYGPDVVMGVPMGCPPLLGCTIKCAYGMKIKRHSGCPRCRCRKCPDFSRCRKVCEHGYMSNDKDCKICKCKRKYSIVYIIIRRPTLHSSGTGMPLMRVNHSQLDWT